jgi:hypothetical protein
MDKVKETILVQKFIYIKKTLNKWNFIFLAIDLFLIVISLVVSYFQSKNLASFINKPIQ